MLSQASSQRFIAFMRGNRDFLVGSDLLHHCGMAHLEDPTVLVVHGQRVLLSHGDALCLDDQEYQAFRTMVRSDPWQQRFLSQPVDERRRVAREMREASLRHTRTMPERSFDVNATEVARWMEIAAASRMVHGHTHLPAEHALADGSARYVLSDWDFEQPSGETRGDVLRWRADGFERLAPAKPI
jgi:UDP-2,3-diacylglucosamine hydrolase